jgi:thioredoxin-dependent peroxiredoxin
MGGQAQPARQLCYDHRMRAVSRWLVIVAMSSLLNLLFPWLARAEMLKVGDLAPAFSTNAIIGNQIVPVRLIDYRGHKVVLYFYPKDNTPGCTKEACAFRDGCAKLQGWGIVVLGCSIDSEMAHRAFATKYGLPFPLLLDPDNKIAKAYGADNGIPILGLDRRITYVIGEDGHILKVYPSVDPGTHAVAIIHDLGADKPPPPPTLAPSVAATPAAARPPTQSHQSDEDTD